VQANIPWEIVPDPTLEQVKPWIGVIVAKDAPVLAAAVIAHPHRLVTLDTKDFIEPPQIGARSGLRICTPGDLLREIRGVLAHRLPGRIRYDEGTGHTSWIPARCLPFAG
jgi:hypothetical protein